MTSVMPQEIHELADRVGRLPKSADPLKAAQMLRMQGVTTIMEFRRRLSGITEDQWRDAVGNSMNIHGVLDPAALRLNISLLLTLPGSAR